jgi:hypothetical protein
MRTRRLLPAAFAVLVLAGCYHQVVQTAPTPAPAGARVIDHEWQMGFLWGLVSPPEINAAEECQGGVARVETQHSFLNSLVGAVTFGLVTPMRVTITCAGGSSSIVTPPIHAGTSTESRAAALEAAIRQAQANGSAYIRY